MVSITYKRQEKKKYGGFSENKSTVKGKGPVCPISNIRLGAQDPRATILLVGNKEIVVNYDALKDRSAKYGWKVPKLSQGGTIDAEIWLMSVAKKIAEIPTTAKMEKRLEEIRIFADMIGVQNFVSKLRRACRV
jgi:hypothetical protein